MQLFDRLGREILPTKAAELLYVHARDILLRVEDAQHSVDAFLGRLRGDLVVGGSTIPGQYVLPGFIGRFRMLHPEVRITLHIGDTRQVVDSVLAGTLEAGVVGAVVEEERLAYSPLMEDELALAGWPGHPLATPGHGGAQEGPAGVPRAGQRHPHVPLQGLAQGGGGPG